MRDEWQLSRSNHLQLLQRLCRLGAGSQKTTYKDNSNSCRYIFSDDGNQWVKYLEQSTLLTRDRSYLILVRFLPDWELGHNCRPIDFLAFHIPDMFACRICSSPSLLLYRFFHTRTLGDTTSSLHVDYAVKRLDSTGSPSKTIEREFESR